MYYYSVLQNCNSFEICYLYFFTFFSQSVTYRPNYVYDTTQLVLWCHWRVNETLWEISRAPRTSFPPPPRRSPSSAVRVAVTVVIRDRNIARCKDRQQDNTAHRPWENASSNARVQHEEQGEQKELQRYVQYAVSVYPNEQHCQTLTLELRRLSATNQRSKHCTGETFPMNAN